MEVPSSPSKRSRVTFDSDVELVSADDEDDLDPLLVKEEIRRGIQRHLNGDDETYAKVRSVFAMDYRKENAPSSRKLKVYLQGLLGHIDSLKGCQGLVKAAVLTEWVGRDSLFVNLYTKFIGSLCSAHSAYIGLVIRNLVELLGKQKTRRISDQKLVRQKTIHERVTIALRYITSKAPAAIGNLAEELRRALSHEYWTPAERTILVKSSLSLGDRVPELKTVILSCITGELVRLDAAIQKDLEDEDEEITEEILQDVSTSQTVLNGSSQTLYKAELQPSDVEDDDEDASTTDESDIEDQDLTPKELELRHVRQNVEQVDVVMNILFRYYNGLMSSPGLSTRDVTIEQLIANFQNLILPTTRSRHSQFLIFHFAQSSPITIDNFVTQLISMLSDRKQPPPIRRSAAAYLAGFVGRGAHVSGEVVRDCFYMLLDDASTLREEAEAVKNKGIKVRPQLNKYSTFYAVMQSLFYIFCFRWRDLAISSSDLSDDESDFEDETYPIANANKIEKFQFPEVLKTQLSLAIDSDLNPLKVCTPIIVEQFAKLSFALNFMYLFSRLETNKRIRLTNSHSRLVLSDLNINQPERDSSWYSDDGILEGLFPYDPYQLPLSKKWLEGDYVEWQGMPGEKEQEEEEDSSESDEEEDDVDIEMMEDLDVPTGTESGAE